TTWPVFGSSIPSTWDPKSLYQIIPSASAAASCGSVSGRGRSYSVMMTRVAFPVGLGSVFNGYCQLDEELRLTDARYRAERAAKRGPRSCGASQWLERSAER